MFRLSPISAVHIRKTFTTDIIKFGKHNINRFRKIRMCADELHIVCIVTVSFFNGSLLSHIFNLLSDNVLV